jgi:hypothetical protein
MLSFGTGLQISRLHPSSVLLKLAPGMMQATDARRLTDEYRRLVDGFQGQGVIPRNNEGWLANPVLPDDILREAVR